MSRSNNHCCQTALTQGVGYYQKGRKATSNQTANWEKMANWEARVPWTKLKGLQDIAGSPFLIIKMAIYWITNGAKAPSIREPFNNQSNNNLEGTSPSPRVANKHPFTHRLRGRITRAIKTRSTTQVVVDAINVGASPSSVSIQQKLDCWKSRRNHLTEK